MAIWGTARKAMVVLASIAALGATAARAAAGAPPAQSGHARLNGVWAPEHGTARLLTEQGKAPPLLPRARRILEQNRAALKAGNRSFDRTTWCASPGLPRLMFGLHPFEIAVSPRRVAFLYSWSNWYRTVDMSGESWPVEDEYSSVGVGMGRWAGDALVVRTVGLRSDVPLDREGLPHSAQLKLTETIRLLSDDRLQVRFRFDDPKTFSRPWEAVMTYRRQPDDAAQEFICLDEIKQGRPGFVEN